MSAEFYAALPVFVSSIHVYFEFDSSVHCSSLSVG